jgi:hypothetical protein
MKGVGVLAAAIFLGVLVCCEAVSGQVPDEITADDFPRPASRDLGAENVFVFRKSTKPVYRLRRATPPRSAPGPARPATKTNKAVTVNTKTNASEAWQQVGVTVWKLAEKDPKAKDTESSRSIVNTSTNKAYGAKRLAANTEFEAGDLVRLSIESPSEGYLYVIDREMRADGSLGSPVQIFPTAMSRGGDNRVQKGLLVDIPSQSDRVPYFTLRSRDPNWRGELLTFILSPVSLPELGRPLKPTPIDAGLMATLEAKYQKEINEYEQEGTEGKPYTKVESEAVGSRQLTVEDPFPQTIYRVKGSEKDVMLFNLRLVIKAN